MDPGGHVLPVSFGDRREPWLPATSALCPSITSGPGDLAVLSRSPWGSSVHAFGLYLNQVLFILYLSWILYSIFKYIVDTCMCFLPLIGEPRWWSILLSVSIILIFFSSHRATGCEGWQDSEKSSNLNPSLRRWQNWCLPPKKLSHLKVGCKAEPTPLSHPSVTCFPFLFITENVNSSTKALTIQVRVLSDARVKNWSIFTVTAKLLWQDSHEGLAILITGAMLLWERWESLTVLLDLAVTSAHQVSPFTFWGPRR